jgi:3-(3-hydroxy-phenyl)propionate hydroxylase
MTVFGADDALLPARVSVLICGGGPVGLLLAALLARHGVHALVIEADASYCQGSRAICVSRRSQEIMAWVGADEALVAKGLPWTGGRSYYRGTEVLHFTMPGEPTQRFAPMVNIQQYYIEAYADAALKQAGGGEVRWNTRVSAVRPQAQSVDVDVVLADGSTRTVHTDWLVACDGGRSTVRDSLGLQLDGMQYDGRYVIVDIEQDTHRDVERLAWFDPPSNPGSTILMHRQPDNVWRIDYQISDGEDPLEAVKPANVLPRVQSHLDMIGESAPWKPLWISIYNAKCLTLPGYQHGRVLFAGDAAHLVPIFGVRGLNSGLDDAGNLAWKLALVQSGQADESLLDSYTTERLHAARENIAYGAKSTEFMAPPNYGFRLLREAALRLALVEPRVRSLINPRQSLPVEYINSSLNQADSGDDFSAGVRAGMPAPEARLLPYGEISHLSAYFGSSFAALYFSDHAELPQTLQAVASHGGSGVGAVRLLRIARTGRPDNTTAVDQLGQAWLRYGATEGALYLIRPDGYVMARWADGRTADLSRALNLLRLQRNHLHE